MLNLLGLIILLILVALVVTAVYLIVSLSVFIISTISAHGLKGYKLQQKYFNHPYFNQLSIIIYAHNDEKAVVSLLEKLNKQDYLKANYQINIVLDNCEDNSSNILEFVGGAKIWRVGDNETLGKDAATSWVLERLVSFQNVNAYVFLDVNCSIEEDFLSNINSALFSGDVLVGNIEIVNENPTLMNNIKCAYNKYHNKIVNTGRRFLFNGLAMPINSTVTVIKQEVLEKVKCIDFQNADTELKYTTLLVKNEIVPKYAPNVTVYVNANEYEPQDASPLKRLSLFWRCLPLTLCTNFKFIEHVFHMIRPGFASVTFLLAVIFTFLFFYKTPSPAFPILINFVIPASILAFFYGVFALAKMDKKEFMYLCLYPVYHILKAFNKFSLFKNLTGKLFSQRKSIQVLEKFSMDVWVSGGQKNFQCKLNIIKENNFAKAVFIFKKKKYVSSSYLKVYEAINEIIEKLDEHGFRMKICQTCGYFCPKFEEGTNDLKGFCHCNKTFNADKSLDEEQQDEKETFFWNLCEKYIPKEINNVVDMSTYR